MPLGKSYPEKQPAIALLMDYISAASSSSTSTLGNGKPNNKTVKRVKLSTDPQSVAARERRHRISEKFKILQSMVPGGSKMDTVSMLEEAIHYVKFLKAQVMLHQSAINYDNSFNNFLHYYNSPIQEQNLSFFDANFVAGEIMKPSVSVPFQEPFFHSEDAATAAMCYDLLDNN